MSQFECPRCRCSDMWNGRTCEECGYTKPAPAAAPKAPAFAADGSFGHWSKSDLERAAVRFRDGRKLGQYKLIPKDILQAALDRLNEEHRILCSSPLGPSS